MSEKDDQIEVEIDDPVVTEKEPEIKVITDTDDDRGNDNTPPVISAEDGIKELRRRLEAEHQARLEAEHYAKYAREQASKAYEEVGETQFHLVSNALDTVKRDAEILRGHLRDAMNIGDHDRAAEIQEAMSRNAIRLNQLEDGKRDSLRLTLRRLLPRSNRIKTPWSKLLKPCHPDLRHGFAQIGIILATSGRFVRCLERMKAL